MEKRLIDRLLLEYGESHKNHTNKAIHWICVPLIMLSIFGLLLAIPFPFMFAMFFNWATVLLFCALLYYLRLSLTMAFSFLVIGVVMVFLSYKILEVLAFNRLHLVFVSISIFVLAWIGQFIGHHIEGKKPSFLKDLQFLLIGPAWLLHFVYKKLGIPY